MITEIQTQKNIKVIFIVGPTASGKSSLALHLAKKFSGQIINIDSVQFYKGLEIGSAAPCANDLSQVPHHLYGYVSVPTEMTAGQYIRDFYQLIENKKLSGPLFIVGGTGFYIQALEKGMYDLPEVDLEIKKNVLDDFQVLGSEKMFNELKKFDPETTLHVNDVYRVGRALEIKRAFNLKMSEFKNKNHLDNKNKLPFPSLKIGMTFDSKDKLLFQNQVHQRSLKMIEQGIVDEVQNFVSQGYEHWAPLHSVGYCETLMFLKNQISFAELPEAITRATMKLVKKQKTWFKKDPSILWSDVFQPNRPRLENQIQDFLD